MSPELSGVDLARQTLAAAREAAKKNGSARTAKPRRRTSTAAHQHGGAPARRRTSTAAHRDGREPLGLGSAISRMMTERGMAAPAAGGTVLAQFDTILATTVPELTDRVRAVAFDMRTGRLDVVPDAPAVGTKLRWSAPKLIAAANQTVPEANVRALNILAPAPVKATPATAATAPAPQPTTPAAPVQQPAPSAGYRRAPPDRPPLPDGPGHRSGGGTADHRAARAQPSRVPRAARVGRRAGPD